MLRRVVIICLLGLPVLAGAGSLRVGPTRLDLSAQRPVAALEVQNSGPAPTLVQIDLLDWSQDGRGDVLTPTQDLVATPLVLNLASGESRVIRVGLRTANRSDAERSYRLFVREVPPAFSDGTNLKFAVRIGVPIFAAPPEARTTAVSSPAEVSWSWVPDIQGCVDVRISNPTARHERVLGAEMLSHSGEVLWRASEPAYVLAWSHRMLFPSLCPPSIKESVTLRLNMESGTVNLPVVAPSLVVDANTPLAR